jgi:hypothetical protein
MFSNRIAFIAIGAACVAAAAGGSYLATRHNVADQMAAPVAASAAPSPATEISDQAPALAQTSQPQAATAAPQASRLNATPPSDRRAVEIRKPAKPEPPRTISAPTASAAHTEQPAVAPEAPMQQPSTADAPPITARTEERPEVPAVQEPGHPSFEELVVAADSVIGLQTETTISSERARVEDRVEARVVRDVRVNGHVAIPAGARVLGSVVVVERGGKMRERARLGIRFHTLALSDGTRLPITTETIYRYGDSPANGSAAKIGGGAVAGAILGAIIGGGKGAVIGATTGAAGGGAAVMTSDRSEAVFQSGAEVTARIISPVSVTVDR